ncbi:MAG TPA: bifunctional 5,10-methylenetetrahydrofolate dehydrogenase/5,10-methenyltetrahydrofolate cyclohydrolase [Solirubrobacteraceae bacterium]|nr:bifunctional 5,10-methylenetetrahydrofolate dehydrogenase/5,10-methenyltetrahydrofolate cyclohydrolase [Solirubrobacteraceae bacterium]
MTELTGKPLSEAIRADVAARAALTPSTLAIISASEDESSAWYVRSLARAAEKVGVGCAIDELAPSADEATIAAAVRARSADPEVSGIILQTPLPPGVDQGRLVAEIDPRKDVDGANPLSIGRLAAKQPAFAPATAAAVVRLLDEHRVVMEGANAVVLGRSLVVGLPAGLLLLHRNATVTTCHSRTHDLPARTRGADILVVAIGRAHMVTPEYVTENTVVVDVGTNVDEEGNLVGDVDPSVVSVARALSPVPGGVGPVTTALLLEHTVTAAESLAAVTPRSRR